MKVSVVGLGYVGSVVAAGLAAAGHSVLGIDSDLTKVRDFKRGVVPFFEPGLAELVRKAGEQGHLEFLHADDVSQPLGEVVFIAVGTPAQEMGAADLSQVTSVLGWIQQRAFGIKAVVMKSTVPPGTGVRLSKSVLQNCELTYVSNPEFLREGQAVTDWFRPDRVVIGGNDAGAVELVRSLYRNLPAPIVVTDITSAEMIKYAANAFLATKISFINEIANVCDLLGATIDEVCKGIALDSRIGPSFLQAGVGYGGSCFPKDVRALDHLALTNGHNFELLKSVINVNNRQRFLPVYALREQFDSFMGIKVAVLGLAFKPRTDDVREAPALDLIRLLVDEGARVAAYDPVAVSAAQKVLPAKVCLSDQLLPCVDQAQAVVLMTEWPQIVKADWQMVRAGMESPHLLFDGRNALDPAHMRELGFAYIGIGRRTQAQQPRTSDLG